MGDQGQGDMGQGLFVTRDVRQGDLVSLYSGLILGQGGNHKLHRGSKSQSEEMYFKK